MSVPPLLCSLAIVLLSYSQRYLFSFFFRCFVLIYFSLSSLYSELISLAYLLDLLSLACVYLLHSAASKTGTLFSELLYRVFGLLFFCIFLFGTLYCYAEKSVSVCALVGFVTLSPLCSLRTLTHQGLCTTTHTFMTRAPKK